MKGQEGTLKEQRADSDKDKGIPASSNICRGHCLYGLCMTDNILFQFHIK
jgi:hypothetical protein